MGLSLRSRRRGLRNSLRSDSPHPFSSVSLVSSPPDKGGIGVCVLACILTPSPCGHSPYIPCRNTGGEFDTWFCCCHYFLTPSPCGYSPYIPCRNTGEKGNTRFGNEVEFYCFVTPRHVTGHGRGGLNAWFSFPSKDSLGCTNLRYLFILLSSEKNEPRSAAAVIGLLGSSLRSPSGSAELAPLGQSSPFFLRLPCDFTAR